MALEEKRGDISQSDIGRELILSKRGIVPIDDLVSSLSTRSGEVVFKDQLHAITFWWGSRNANFSDLDKFRDVIDSPLGLNLAAQFEIPTATEIGEDYPQLQSLGRRLAQVLEVISGPLVVFILTTPEVAEFSWLERFPQNLRQYRENQGRKNTFIHKIIVEGLSFSDSYEMLPQDPQGRFRREELKAHQLGGVYLTFDTDYPTKSSVRIAEFMKRVLGADLPGKEFPNYPWEDIARIAWHINREDFDISAERVHAIPKYPIVNGRPKFPF